MKKVLFALLVFCTSQLFASVQTMIIPTGTVNVTDQSFSVNAYCRNKGRINPPEDFPFINANGTVKVTYRNNVTKTFHDNEVLSLFKGNGSYFSINFDNENNNIIRLEVIQSVVLFGDDKDKISQYSTSIQSIKSVTLKKVLDESDPNYFLQENQLINDCRKLWAQDFKRTRNNGIVKVQYLNSDNNMEVYKPKLTSHGTANIVVTPTNEIILYDTGYSEGDYNAISSKINSIRQEKGINDIEIYIVASHGDEDHIGNIRRIIENDGVHIKNVIIPKSNKIESLRTDLVSYGYNVTHENDVMEILSKPKSSKVKISDNRRFLHRYVKNKILDDDDEKSMKALHDYTLTTGKGYKFSIFGLTKWDRMSENNCSLMMKVNNNNFSYLCTGDVSSKGIRQLLESQYMYSKINEVQNKLISDYAYREKYLKYQKLIDAEMEKFRSSFFNKLWYGFVLKLFYNNYEIKEIKHIAQLSKMVEVQGYAEFKYLTLDNIFSMNKLRSTFIDWFHHAEYKDNQKKTYTYLLSVLDPLDLNFNMSNKKSKGQNIQNITKYIKNRRNSLNLQYNTYSTIDYKSIQYLF